MKRDSTTNQPGGAARLRAALPDLSQSERGVAEWVLANGERAVRMSMAEIAQENQVSDTTVLRMCRSAGFAGFTDLRLDLARDLASPTALVHERVEVGDSTDVIISKVFALSVQALTDTAHALDLPAFERLIAALDRARTVLVVGYGGSQVVANAWYQRCQRLGINCQAPADVQLQLIQASHLDERDLVLGLSYSGATTDVAMVLAEARRQGATTAAVTSSKSNHLAAEADIVLTTVSYETRSEPIAARLAQLAIIDAFSVVYSMGRLEETLQAERRIEAAIVTKLI